MKNPVLSMTGRLISGLFICTAVIFICSGYVLHQKIEQVVVSSIEQNLVSRLKVITGLLHEENGSIEMDQSDVISGQYSIPRSGHYYMVTMDGMPLAVSPSLTGYDHYFKDLPIQSGSADSSQQYQLFTVTGPVGEPARVLRYHLESDGHRIEVIVAQSLAPSLAVIDSFQQMLLITIACGTIVLCIIAWIIARRSLRPLRELSATMEKISYDKLDSRLDRENSVLELKQLSTSFNSLLDRLGNAFDSQKRLVADASHELKTPVAVIKTQCDVILQRKRTAEEYVEALETIEESAVNISKLVNDLLSLARLDAGIVSRENFQTIRLSDCISHTINQTSPLAEQKQIAISVEDSGEVQLKGAETQLKEALLNLVENAIRYNREGGKVFIKTAAGPDRAVITVRDNGIGMPEDVLEKIFERFFRGDSQRSTEGTGLGLSIVKSVVDAHNGSITCESTPGKGTCFTVTLPLGA